MIPPTADELLAEIDRAQGVDEMFAWVEAEDEPSWLHILTVWTVLIIASLVVWSVAITAVSRVVRHLVAS